MIKVLIVEDQSMVGGALQALVDLESDLTVTALVTGAEAALAAIESEMPDVVVSDIEMPGMSGLELAGRLGKEYPNLKVIMLTTFARAGYLRRALEAGVAGYLLKDAPAVQLADAIRHVNRGGRRIDPELASAAWGEADPLSDRERQVLKLAADGMSNQDIGDQLHLAHGTVRNYLSEIMAKLQASNRTEAARIARQKGWL